MNTIKVKDFDSMQAITVSLARNGYLVTADSVTDENYKDHWEIKYCEFSEIEEKSNDNDFDGDYLGSMEICSKGVTCEPLPEDEKPSEENDNDPPFKPVHFDEKGNIIKNNKKEILNNYGLVPRHKDLDIPVIPNMDTSDNITDEQMTIITSVSGN